VFNLRPGRSWRHNPSYAGELARLEGEAVRKFDGARILDVLGIEVDGVDIAAGIGEAPLCEMVDELIQAGLFLASGSPAAQATVGPGPTQLVLEPRGEDVLLTLISQRPPARILAGGLLVDRQRLRKAMVGAGQRVIADLLDVNAGLRASDWVQRITRDLRQLARAATVPAQPWPPEGNKQAGFVAKSVASAVRLEVRVPAPSAAKLAARHLAPQSMLAPLLGPGSIALRFEGGAALSIEAPPYLALRELVRSAEELVRAFESGEPAFLLRWGTLSLRCDLTRDELRAEGLRDAVNAPPLILAEACATAARAFARRALELGAKERPAPAPAKKSRAIKSSSEADRPLLELSKSASELLKHCRDLSSGDLRRAPESVRAPPLPLPAPKAAPAPMQGSVRRLVHRLAFELPVGPIPETGIHLFPAAHTAVLQGAAGVFAIDLKTSARLWHLAGVSSLPHALARAGSGPELFVLQDDALLRIDPASGEQLFRRVVRGAGARIFSVAGGCILSLASGGLVFIRDGGVLAFRTKLPEEPTAAIAADGLLIVQLASGQLVALDTRDGAGAERWRRRVGVRAGAVQLHGQHLLATACDARGAQRIICLALATGETLWEHDLPPIPNLAPAQVEPGALVLFGERCATLAGRGLVAVHVGTGALAFSRALPWPSNQRLFAIAPADVSDAPGLLALGPGAAALRFDERGQQLWSRPALTATLHPPLAPAQSGPALLLSDGSAELVDIATGRTLAKPAMADVDTAALLPDLSTLLHLRDGTLAFMKLATHLSLV
jgi:outer membrane protein assembly factor BamB